MAEASYSARVFIQFERMDAENMLTLALRHGAALRVGLIEVQCTHQTFLRTCAFDGVECYELAREDSMTLKLEAEATRLTGTARSILEMKGRLVHSIGPRDSVYAAVAKLSECQVGALFVLEGSALIGVISERDYARKVILQGRSSRETRVEEIMSSPVIRVEPATPLTECMRIMNEQHFRHLPVMEGTQIIGVISIGDLIHTVIRQQAQTIAQLNTLITDPYPG
jgi:CBS domain-containing protein